MTSEASPTTQETEVTIVLTFGPTVCRTAHQAVSPVADVKSCRHARRRYFISLKVTRVQAEDVAASAASEAHEGQTRAPPSFIALALPSGGEKEGR